VPAPLLASLAGSKNRASNYTASENMTLTAYSWKKEKAKAIANTIADNTPGLSQ